MVCVQFELTVTSAIWEVQWGENAQVLRSDERTAKEVEIPNELKSCLQHLN